MRYYQVPSVDVVDAIVLCYERFGTVQKRTHVCVNMPCWVTFRGAWLYVTGKSLVAEVTKGFAFCLGFFTGYEDVEDFTIVVFLSHDCYIKGIVTEFWGNG